MSDVKMFSLRIFGQLISSSVQTESDSTNSQHMEARGGGEPNCACVTAADLQVVIDRCAHVEAGR